jgi:hypothetical protein
MARWFKLTQDTDTIFINRDKIAVVKIRRVQDESQVNAWYVVEFIGQAETPLFDTSYANPSDAAQLVEEFLVGDEQY